MAFSCPVDIEDWRLRNRVPVSPGKLERWLIRLPLPKDGPSGVGWERESVEAAVTDLFARWQSLFRTGRPHVVAFSESPNQFLPGLAVRPGTLPDKFSVRNRERPEVYALVEVQIAGSQTSVPWPTFRTTRKPEPNGERLHPFCPRDVDAFLVAASDEPEEGEEGFDLQPSRDVSPIPDGGLPDFSEPVRDAGETLRTVAKVVLWGGAALVLWQVWQASQDVRGRIRGK